MKFRKKPIEVEARRWPGDEGLEAAAVQAWAHGTYRRLMPDKTVQLVVPTLEGFMAADRGDWIIKGVKGEFYPIKDAVFRETYEAVE